MRPTPTAHPGVSTALFASTSNRHRNNGASLTGHHRRRGLSGFLNNIANAAASPSIAT
jgi:hypothetical protein